MGDGGLLGWFRNVLTYWFWRQGGDRGKSPGFRQISWAAWGPASTKFPPVLWTPLLVG